MTRIQFGLAATVLSIALAPAVQAQPAGTISVTGTLTDAGVQCRAMLGDDGVTYTMRRGRALAEFRTGDRIRVTGGIAQASICQQGTTIESPTIEKAD